MGDERERGSGRAGERGEDEQWGGQGEREEHARRGCWGSLRGVRGYGVPLLRHRRAAEALGQELVWRAWDGESVELGHCWSG